MRSGFARRTSNQGAEKRKNQSWGGYPASATIDGSVTSFWAGDHDIGHLSVLVAGGATWRQGRLWNWMTWNDMRYEDVNWPIDHVFQDYWTFLVVDLYNLDIPLFSWGVKPRHWSFEFLLTCVTFVPWVVAHCDKKRRHELRLLGLQQEGPIWNLKMPMAGKDMRKK